MYSTDKNIQILTYLLKAHKVTTIITSPGICNAAFVAGIQSDPDFKVFSCVDERSAAYLAVGMAEKSSEPVAITCTEATASRNYMSALTEAYYRKLPILAITFNHGESAIGNLGQQSINREQLPKDIALMSVNIRPKDHREEWFNVIQLNKALLELTHRGGGPVHINIRSGAIDNCVKELPKTRVIHRYIPTDSLPQIPKVERIAILCIAHKKMSASLVKAIDSFCAIHDAIVLCDHTSGYYGEYRVDFTLPMSQNDYKPELKNIDLLIHIGEICAVGINPKETWRVNEDGELRDKFHTLTNVFEMTEEYFFNQYADSYPKSPKNKQLQLWNNEYTDLFSKLPNLPFSNIWCASQLAPQLPQNCTIHFSILNSLRSWNFFRLSPTITTNCNVGGFGIDGCVSTLIGASLLDPSTLHYMIVGDLAFFYDMNSLGIRHIGNNLRIIIINNGRGTEFRLPGHPAYGLGEAADSNVAAAGHYGKKSKNLIRHYAQDLGFTYLTASSKEEFLQLIDTLTNPKLSENSIVCEVFTETINENEALKLITTIKTDTSTVIKKRVKDTITGVIGQNTASKIKSVLKKQ